MQVTVSVGLTPDLITELRKIASEEQRSVSWLIGRAVQDYLDRRAEPAPRRKGKAA